MSSPHVTAAFQRLTHTVSHPPDLVTAVAAITSLARGVEGTPDGTTTPPAPEVAGLIDALVVLHWAQAQLAEIEPALIATARAAGVSWQTLAPALGVASRQAAERRYLRLIPASSADESTQDERVRAERDRRAGHRAVDQWANDNTADLRRLAGQITALTDLGEDAVEDVQRLHHALADSDATALPGLLANTQRHLDDHPNLADQVDTVTTRTREVRRRTQHQRDSVAARLEEDSPDRANPPRKVS